MPTDYGTDIACGPDGLDPHFGLVSGRACLIESVLHRLETVRGSLDDAPNDGFDVSGWLNREIDATTRFALEQAIGGEVRKDERIADARCRVTDVPASPPGARKLTIALAVTPADGPAFRLTVAIDQLGVELLSVA